ncbi:hypothetical protein NL108_012828 [Boleophthalmus pectinirostris]|uniref:UPF0728 protein C10orf53 homolog n=1 Tax=Boleophthalmus pectinirostris TaxID=150288 RepID=UPI000A1C3E43|nr:UPF0728 protein C10orf53 homolog [Boleophthalmus pectinirostris]KAJ0067145.1 hypothetical protein NL108_012828 [Boleophthalmus pectinirostris]
MSEQAALVTVLYGPYESCGLVQHRTYRLQGIRAALTARGYTCALKETRERNRVELLFRGRIVFSCDITSLEFGGDGRLDPLCKEAVLAVDNAF